MCETLGDDLLINVIKNCKSKRQIHRRIMARLQNMPAKGVCTEISLIHERAFEGWAEDIAATED